MIIALFICFIGMAVSGYYFYYKYTSLLTAYDELLEQRFNLMERNERSNVKSIFTYIYK